MSNKFAWVWNIKPEYTEEYVRLHASVWENVLEEHRKAGIRNYSIFQNGNQFFYVYESDDIDATCAYIAGSQACQEWDSITSKMVEGSFDWGGETPVKFLKEVFYLP